VRYVTRSQWTLRALAHPECNLDDVLELGNPYVMTVSWSCGKLNSLTLPCHGQAPTRGNVVTLCAAIADGAGPFQPIACHIDSDTRSAETRRRLTTVAAWGLDPLRDRPGRTSRRVLSRYRGATRPAARTNATNGRVPDEGTPDYERQCRRCRCVAHHKIDGIRVE
jgi:hypothetical protein